MGEDHVKPASSLHSLTPPKTDVLVAQEFRDDLRPLLEQMMRLMDNARSQGMQLNYAITMNGFGKSVISEITVMKLL